MRKDLSGRAATCAAWAGARRLAALSCALTLAVPALAAPKPRPAEGQPVQPQATAADAKGSQKPAPANSGAKPGDPVKPGDAPAKPAEVQKFDIDEFEVQGADALPQIELEAAVYPFMGPNRTPADVEKARAALEKAYQAKGLQTVSVSVPPQNVERRVVVLKVAEAKVGRLRIKGSRYFDQEKIKDRARSLQEGELPDFDDVTKDVVALNQWPNRRVTPALRAGVKPGTVDVDLNVEDTLPFHASVELNNRRTANTKPLRLQGTARYENLWQLGHSLTLNASVAPQKPEQSNSFSASYLARLPDNEQLSFLFSALKSRGKTLSTFDIEGVGGASGSSSGAALANSPTAQLGARAVFTLPAVGNYFHTINTGVDYKESDQSVFTTIDGGDDDLETLSKSPLKYWTGNATYSGTYQGEKGLTQLNADLVLGLRGLGDDTEAFLIKRFQSQGNFVSLKGDVAHTAELPKGFQLFAKTQGQLSNQALVSSEQFGLGGLDSVRGYLESESVGDNGLFGTLELRTPNLATLWNAPPSDDKEPTKEAGKDGGADEIAPEAKRNPLNELRFFGFIDGGFATLNDPLPEELDRFDAWSVGAGVNFKSFEYFNGSVLVALPMEALPSGGDVTTARDPRVLFRFWGEF